MKLNCLYPDNNKEREVAEATCDLSLRESFTHPPLLLDPTLTQTQTQTKIANAAAERGSRLHRVLIEL